MDGWMHRRTDDERTGGRTGERTTDRRTDGRTDGQTDERTNGQTDGRKDGRTDGRTVGRTDELTDERTHGLGVWQDERGKKTYVDERTRLSVHSARRFDQSIYRQYSSTPLFHMLFLDNWPRFPSGSSHLIVYPPDRIPARSNAFYRRIETKNLDPAENESIQHRRLCYHVSKHCSYRL